MSHQFTEDKYNTLIETEKFRDFVESISDEAWDNFENNQNSSTLRNEILHYPEPEIFSDMGLNLHNGDDANKLADYIEQLGF